MAKVFCNIFMHSINIQNMYKFSKYNMFYEHEKVKRHPDWEYFTNLSKLCSWIKIIKFQYLSLTFTW